MHMIITPDISVIIDLSFVERIIRLLDPQLWNLIFDSDATFRVLHIYNVFKSALYQNQINIPLIRWQNTTTVTDAKVVYTDTMLPDQRRTKLSSG